MISCIRISSFCNQSYHINSTCTEPEIHKPTGNFNLSGGGGKSIIFIIPLKIFFVSVHELCGSLINQCSTRHFIFFFILSKLFSFLFFLFIIFFFFFFSFHSLFFKTLILAHFVQILNQRMIKINQMMDRPFHTESAVARERQHEPPCYGADAAHASSVSSRRWRPRRHTVASVSRGSPWSSCSCAQPRSSWVAPCLTLWLSRRQSNSTTERKFSHLNKQLFY